MTIRTLFVLFDQVDLLDVGGPYEVFLTANRLAERQGDPAPFSVASASVDGAPVTAYGGLMLAPTAFELLPVNYEPHATLGHLHHLCDCALQVSHRARCWQFNLCDLTGDASYADVFGAWLHLLRLRDKLLKLSPLAR